MPKRYAEAIAIVGGKTPRRIGKYSGPDLVAKMKEYGIQGQEFGFVGDLGTSIDDTLKQKGFRPTNAKLTEGVATLGVAPALRAWSRVGRAAGTSVEDTSRVALFLDQIKKGKNPEDAALHVKKYLFDYQELADVERTVFRRAVSFYTWLRKNIPLQLEHFIATPHKYSNVASAYKEMEGATDDMGLRIPTADRPDFLRKLGTVQLPFTSTSGEKEFFNPNLPFQDLAKVFPNIENMQDQLASLHPLAKSAIEIGTNKSIFKDRPLYLDSYHELVRAPMAAQLVANLLPDQVQALGMKLRKQDGRAQWLMPQSVAYAIEQLPVFNTLGKASMNIGDPASAAALPILPEGLEGNSVAEKLMRPPAIDFLMGMKFLPQSDAQIRRDKKYRRRAEKRRAGRQRTMDTSLLSPDEIDELLGR